MVEGLKQRFHGKPQSHYEDDDEEFFESDSFSSDSDDESSAEVASSLPHLNSNGPLCEMSSLMEHLPIKRGLSKYYQGKSQSFTSLSDVRCIEDLPKKINNCRRNIKSCKSYAGLDAKQKFAHVPGLCSKTISKKAPRVSSCASLIQRTNSSGLVSNNNPSPVFSPTNLCP